ncbi:MAG TPA: cell division protein FtsZ [Phnomibacter sp.]|nr:cell division protein FtsZ [Phnomibacter sp.]
MIHFDMPKDKSNIIKVLGFGGGGGNAVNHMYRQQIQNVDFVICNTDAQALQGSPIPNKIQLGPNLTQGLGAGANPQIGKEATEESLDDIRRILEVNTKMAFLTAGMGGGTGTGGAPTVAKICRELGILTVGIVTTPFQFEGPRRMAQARQGIEELKSEVDTLLVISNDKLRHQFGNLKMKDAFSKADDVLTTAARCITDVINTTGQINVDFADVCTVMRNGGVAILGSATAAGEGRALRAIEEAVNSPLLNDNDISGAKWILLNISSAEGDFEYTMEEVEAIQEYVRAQTGDNTDVILGMGYEESLGENIGITIIATGFQHKDPFEKSQAAKPQMVEVAPTPVAPVPAPEAVEEDPIFMTLGVEGEEQKMQNTTPAPEVVAETIEVAPALQPEPVAELPVAVVEEPVASVVEEEESQEEESNTIVFELTLDEPVIAVATTETVEAFVAPVEEEKPAVEAEVKKEEELLVVPGFLNKPSQIYFEPTVQEAPAPKEDESLMPVLTEMPEEEIAPMAMEEAEERMKMVVTEEWNAENEALAGMSLSFEENVEQPMASMDAPQLNMFGNNEMGDLSADEEHKRKAKERINRLRNLSFNTQHLDPGVNAEFEQVPAYMRRDMHNSIANVEDFYSRTRVKVDDNNEVNLSSLNNFLHGDKPD